MRYWIPVVFLWFETGGFYPYPFRVTSLAQNQAYDCPIPSDAVLTTWVNTSKGTTWWRHQMEAFSALLALCAGNSPATVNSPHKGQWRGALMFSLACVWINGWTNNREAGDLRHHRAHYIVIVMRRSRDRDYFVYAPNQWEKTLQCLSLAGPVNKMMAVKKITITVQNPCFLSGCWNMYVPIFVLHRLSCVKYIIVPGMQNKIKSFLCWIWFRRPENILAFSDISEP